MTVMIKNIQHLAVVFKCSYEITIHRVHTDHDADTLGKTFPKQLSPKLHLDYKFSQ